MYTKLKTHEFLEYILNLSVYYSIKCKACHAKLSTLQDIFVEAYFGPVEYFSIVSHLLSKKTNVLNENCTLLQ